jgi:hypothetical protein
LAQFPRVVIYFDKSSVELTEQCAKELGEIESTEGLVEWHRKFGMSYSCLLRLT